MDYRPEGADRFETPAEVCGTCSDFDAGALVPVSFCPIAKGHSDERYAYLWQDGPCPAWMDGPGGDPGGDAMVVRFTEAGRPAP